MRYVAFELIGEGRGGPAEVQAMWFDEADGTLIQERNALMKLDRIAYVQESRELGPGWNDPVGDVIGILKYPKGYAAYSYADAVVVLCGETTPEFQKLAHLAVPLVVSEEDKYDFIEKMYPDIGDELWDLG